MFISLLHRNGSFSIAACVFISAVTSLPSRCLQMNHTDIQTSCQKIMDTVLIKYTVYWFRISKCAILSTSDFDFIRNGLTNERLIRSEHVNIREVTNSSYYVAETFLMKFVVSQSYAHFSVFVKQY
jgi:hypothetical protein